MEDSAINYEHIQQQGSISTNFEIIDGGGPLTIFCKKKGRNYSDLIKHRKFQGKQYLTCTKGSYQAECTIKQTDLLEKSEKLISQGANMPSQDNSHSKAHTLKHAYTPYLSATYTTLNIKWLEKLKSAKVGEQYTGMIKKVRAHQDP